VEGSLADRALSVFAGCCAALLLSATPAFAPPPPPPPVPQDIPFNLALAGGNAALEACKLIGARIGVEIADKEGTAKVLFAGDGVGKWDIGDMQRKVGNVIAHDAPVYGGVPIRNDDKLIGVVAMGGGWPELWARVGGPSACADAARQKIESGLASR
jgi:uncharacterized protein GlcG (DUF336 family)